MAATRTSWEASLGSNLTAALSVARLTAALWTPGTLRKADSMVRTQLAHVMPRTANGHWTSGMLDLKVVLGLPGLTWFSFPFAWVMPQSQLARRPRGSPREGLGCASGAGAYCCQ